ncbi:unnamed protein product [Closterium sp. NIES-54]
MLEFPFFTWYRARFPNGLPFPLQFFFPKGPPHASLTPRPFRRRRPLPLSPSSSRHLLAATSPPPRSADFATASSPPADFPTTADFPRIPHGFPRRRGFPADSPCIPAAACPPRPRDLFVADYPRIPPPPRISRGIPADTRRRLPSPPPRPFRPLRRPLSAAFPAPPPLPSSSSRGIPSCSSSSGSGSSSNSSRSNSRRGPAAAPPPPPGRRGSTRRRLPLDRRRFTRRRLPLGRRGSTRRRPSWPTPLLFLSPLLSTPLRLISCSLLQIVPPSTGTHSSAAFAASFKTPSSDPTASLTSSFAVRRLSNRPHPGEPPLLPPRPGPPPPEPNLTVATTPELQAAADATFLHNRREYLIRKAGHGVALLNYDFASSERSTRLELIAEYNTSMAAYVPNSVAWAAADNRACTILLGALPDALMRRFQAREMRAHLIWTELQFMFERRDISSVGVLFKEYFSITLATCDGAVDYVGRMQEVADRLAARQAALSEPLQIHRLLFSLTPDYESRLHAFTEANPLAGLPEVTSGSLTRRSSSAPLLSTSPPLTPPPPSMPHISL